MHTIRLQKGDRVILAIGRRHFGRIRVAVEVAVPTGLHAYGVCVECCQVELVNRPVLPQIGYVGIRPLTDLVVFVDVKDMPLRDGVSVAASGKCRVDGLPFLWNSWHTPPLRWESSFSHRMQRFQTLFRQPSYLRC
jgi:hypothetical protein